jgi:hypothetical protein
MSNLELSNGNNIFKYQNLEYTTGQIDLLNLIAYEVQKFKKGKRGNQILISGFAGTGKTTVIENLFKYGLEYGTFSGCVILAPTNKAKMVLQSKVKVKEDYFNTIHSFIYGSPDEKGDWHVKTDVKNYYVLVDESSMISEDVYNDINKTFNNSLIVFIGDGFQLEPVGKDIGLLKNPNLTLTEVKRNAGDILAYSIKLRETKNTDFDEFESIISLDSHRAIDEYVEDVKNNKDVIYICADNNVRVSINIKCRRRLFPNNNDLIIVNDRMISIANSKFFANGETFTVDEIKIIKEKEIRFTDYYGNEIIEKILVCFINNMTCLVMLDTKKPSIIHSQFSYIDLEDLEDLVGNLNIEWNETGRKYSLKRDVVICTYGYGIVCHKAQGSQWDKVYVQLPSYKPKWDEIRWLYTAITRAVNKLIIIK